MVVPASVRSWRSTQRPLNDNGTGAAGAGEIISVAFLGRTSTYDQQDPTLSLPRQVHACQAVLPVNARLVAFFYDIESGRLPLAERGSGPAHQQLAVPVRRDGGLRELLEEAERADRRFSVVICEDIGRAGRRSFVSTEIEHRLEACGVRLIAADEPFRLDGNARNSRSATEVLTRRLKQGVAEWYVMEMLEKSWGGFEIHTEQGFNIGKPCYGYRAEQVAHPVPAKREKGVKKTRLVVDPVEGAVVRRIFEWRIAVRLSYASIADRLNTDLAANPPPVPVDPKRAVGRWSGSSVREVLSNPKHTGYMVWNRRSSKGKPRSQTNPIEHWVWSPEPVHEALVSLEAFLLAQDVAAHLQGSRAEPTTSTAGDPNREYLLRGFVFCAQCGRRMFGNQRGNHRYYACAPKPSQRQEEHPVAIRVREDHLLEAVNAAIAANVFGT
jgi:DNA invertase Pin-like site-specific DNA recombinase